MFPTTLSPSRYSLGAGAIALAGLLVLSACEDRTEPAPPETYFEISVATHPVKVQLALTIAERRQGLMKRPSLAEDEGMLFVFERPQRASFWMRDTEIPLDVGFFSGDGVLREIYQLQPFVERPVESFRDDVVLALEVNEGWFRARDIVPGDRMDINAVIRAIRLRGEDPAEYALEQASSLTR